MLIIPAREDEFIDQYRPGTTLVAPEVTQTDDPGEDVQNVGGDQGYVLPSPSVGGQNASREQNGFSTGFRSMFTRLQPFTGAVAKPPAITNPVQGEVGRSNRGGRLYAGVMNQAVTYEADALTSAIGYVAGGTS